MSLIIKQQITVRRPSQVIHCDQVDRPFGKIDPGIPKNKGCLNYIVSGNVVRNVHNSGSRYAGQQRSFKIGAVVIPQSEICRKGYH